jgi:hypothetical protein
MAVVSVVSTGHDNLRLVKLVRIDVERFKLVRIS